MGDVMASLDILGIRPSGEEVRIIAQIGRPHRVESGAEGGDQPGGWACAVELTPLYGELPEIRGIDSFHAMWLAASLVLKLLKHFKATGGHLLNDDGSEFPLDAYAAGLGD
jgi:hypothetical protein